MATKRILVCDSCGREIKEDKDHYHIDFESSRFMDGAGDMDSRDIRVDLCEICCKQCVASLKKIAEAKGE